MKNIIILPLILNLVLTASAQKEKKSELITQINHDIWIPFLNGVNTNSPNMYNGVHSANFYWVMEGNKTRIMNFKEYVDDAAKVMKDREANGIKTMLDVRFTERNINSEFASERCVIKYISIEPDKEPNEFYSYTQVFSRKENGVWKKIVQYNLTETATKESFENAIPIK
jgi:hypothetical protein